MNARMTAKTNGVNVTPANLYNDMGLSMLVTRQEAAVLWNKAYTTIDMALAKNKLAARKTLTGGTILITVASLVKLWGNPEDLTLWECFTGSIDTTTEDVLIMATKGQGE